MSTTQQQKQLSQSQASWGTSDFKPNMSHQKREKKEKGHKASIIVILLGYYQAI